MVDFSASARKNEYIYSHCVHFFFIMCIVVLIPFALNNICFCSDVIIIINLYYKFSLISALRKES